MLRFIKTASVVILLGMSLSADAFSLKQGHALQVLISQKSQNVAPSRSVQPVYVEQFNFTPEQKMQLAQRVKNKMTISLAEINSGLPVTKQLGMNGVPVLDQGMHGSCVTFANTAAIDAVLGRGDYISQLCQLSLGQYFENNSQTYPSGWDGSYGQLVLNQISNFGFIPKSQESHALCGGLTAYPADAEYGSPMALEYFSSLSDQSKVSFVSQPLLSMLDTLMFGKDIYPVLYKIKSALSAGDRVTIGVLLDVEKGVGAEGQFHGSQDTWVMTPRIEKHLQLGMISAGHELVVTGYDDNAVVQDLDGVAHSGLFTLRNSWGDKAGDEGNYYMTYDYFLLMALEAQRIIEF